MGFLLLGVDSFIACIAIGPIISRKGYAPLAALFGICDAGGFLLGSAFHWSVPASDGAVIQTAILALLGLYWIGSAVLARAAKSVSAASPWLMWILPFALIIDNITFGMAGDGTGALLGQAGQQLASSALLAAVGLAVGAAVARAIPAVRQRAAVANGVAGGALVLASGALLLVG